MEENNKKERYLSEERTPESRHLAGCHQLGQYGSGRDVYADGVGKPSGTSAIDSVG